MLNYTLFNDNNIKIGNYLDYFYIPIGHRCGTTIALNHIKLKKFSLGFFNTFKVIGALEDRRTND